MTTRLTCVLRGGLQLARLCPYLVALGVVLTLGSSSLFAQDTGGASGTLSGLVISNETHRPLEFAVIDITGTNIQTVTGRDGTFRVRNVPAGSHSVQVSYSGLEGVTQPVTISSGAEATVTITLKAPEAVTLEALTVTGERSGIAAAIQQQRKAANTVSVITADLFGGVADGKIDDALKRIPGVGLSSTRFTIRGVPDTENSITIDGARLASANRAQGRTIETDRVPGDRIARIEVNKSLLPDMNADAVGGTINLVSKSAFDVPAGTLDYSFAASGLKGLNDDPDVGYAGALNYSNVFGILGRDNNLGINLSVSKSDKPLISDHPSAGNEMINVFSNRGLPGNANPSPDLMVDGVSFPITIRRIKRVESADRTNFGIKLDYRFSSESSVWFNMFRSQRELEQVQLNSRLQIGQPLAPLAVDAQGNPVSATAQGIMPGFQSKGIIRWRNAQTQMDNDFVVDDSTVWLFQGDGTHAFGKYKLTWDAAYSTDDSDFDRKLLALTGANGVHATIDRSDLLKPKITYTGGTTPLQYGLENATQAVIQNQRFKNDNTLVTMKADISRELDTRFPITLKAGGQYRNQQFNMNPVLNQVHTYNGPLADLANFATRPINPFGIFDDRVNVDPKKGAADLAANPQRWVFDPVAGFRQGIAQDGDIEETVSAAYVMGQMRVKKLTITGGVRWEGTEVEGSGYLFKGAPAGVPLEQQYTLVHTKGDYDNYFPSGFVQYEIRRNLQIRASYSNGIGRPAFMVLRPTTNVTTTSTTGAAGTISQPDPSLKPQYVDNYDIGLEYYFEPAGSISASVFRKKISDFHDTVTRRLDSTGGGFGAEFANFDLTTRRNIGNGEINGWELAYQQQYVFLPGLLSGLGGFANWTHLDADLQTVTLGADGIANYIPDTVNLGLSYQRSPVTIRVLGFWRSDYVLAFNNPSVVSFLRKQIFDMDVKLEYAFSRRLRVFCDVYNILRSSPLTSEGNKIDDFELRPAYIYQRPLQIEIGIKGTW